MWGKVRGDLGKGKGKCGNMKMCVGRCRRVYG